MGGLLNPSAVKKKTKAGFSSSYNKFMDKASSYKEANDIMAKVKGTKYVAPKTTTPTVRTSYAGSGGGGGGTYNSGDLSADQVTSAITKLRNAGIIGGADKSIGDSLNIERDPYDREYSAIERYYRDEFNQKIDPNQIYQDQLRQYQSEIDAVNGIYQQQLAQARIQGLGRLGSNNALMARSGLAGSDFGQAANENIVGYNTGIESGVQNEQLAKVGEIMGTVRKNAADEVAAKRAAKAAGASNYMEFLKGKKERKASAAERVAKQIYNAGLNINTLDWKKTLKGSDLSQEDIIDYYNTIKSTADEKTKKDALDERKVAVTEEKNRIDEMYKNGLLTDQEYDRQVSWFNAETNRINANKSGSSGGTLGVANVRNLQSKTSLSGEEIKELDKMAFENGLMPTLDAQVAAGIITQPEADYFKAEYEKALSMEEYFQSIISGGQTNTPAPVGNEPAPSLTENYQD